MRWRHTNAVLYHQWEEDEGRAEKWEKAAKEERKQHEWATYSRRHKHGPRMNYRSVTF